MELVLDGENREDTRDGENREAALIVAIVARGPLIAGCPRTNVSATSPLTVRT